MQEMAHYHFEMLNLGYGAYLTFREFCGELFPGSPTRRHADGGGQELILFRPDAELRELPRLARTSSSPRMFGDGSEPGAILAELARTPAGRSWMDALGP